jgi:membrane protein YdbS with pleckstrin-like domain
MLDYPTQKLDPRVKGAWRVNDAIWLTLTELSVCLALGIPYVMLAAGSVQGVLGILLVASLVCYAAALVVFLAILPPIRYARWRFELSDDYLQIAKGIIWRTRYVIPFIRVQNTDTRQGPILRAFGLATVTVSTASDAHEIPGLAFEEAERMRDRAAELARLAREDV